MAKNEMTFKYDEEEDILYAYLGNAPASIYDAIGGGIYIRIDPESGEPVGFMIMDFSKKQRRNRRVDIPHFSGIRIPPLHSITI